MTKEPMSVEIGGQTYKVIGYMKRSSSSYERPRRQALAYLALGLLLLVSGTVLMFTLSLRAGMFLVTASMLPVTLAEYRLRAFFDSPTENTYFICQEGAVEEP